MQLYDDVELLNKIKDGSQSAFSIIVDRYSKPLFSYIYKRLGDADDTNDVIQEVFMSLWLNKHRIEIEKSIYPYLSKAAHYITIKTYFSLNKKVPFETIINSVHESVEHSIESEIMAKDLQEEINLALLKLPKTTQKIFNLRRYSDLTLKEIALELGLSEQTVKNNLTIALSTFRALIKSGKLTVVISLIRWIHNDFR